VCLLTSENDWSWYISHTVNIDFKWRGAKNHLINNFKSLFVIGKCPYIHLPTVRYVSQNTYKFYYSSIIVVRFFAVSVFCRNSKDMPTWWKEGYDSIFYWDLSRFLLVLLLKRQQREIYDLGFLCKSAPPDALLLSKITPNLRTWSCRLLKKLQSRKCGIAVPVQYFFKKLRNSDCGSTSFKLRNCHCRRKKFAPAHLCAGETAVSQ
jgi:hypothetical protein